MVTIINTFLAQYKKRVFNALFSVKAFYFAHLIAVNTLVLLLGILLNHYKITVICI